VEKWYPAFHVPRVARCPFWEAWGFFRSRQVMELRVAVAAGLVFIMLGAALVAALPSNRNGQQPIA